MAAWIISTVAWWIVSSTVVTLIIIGLLYAFQGLISFVPFLIWLIFKFLYYPIELISQSIYPVGSIVYIVYTWLIFWIVLKLIVDFFAHKSS